MIVRRRFLCMTCTAVTICAGLLVMSMVGCGSGGSGRAAVTGKVTLQGEPVANGVIAFVPTDGTRGPSSGAKIENGEFTVPGDKGPMPGTYLVRINASRPTGRKVEAGPPAPPGTMVDDLAEYIPPQYNANTTLKRDIKSGTNQLNFEL